jgi:uncharacterized protein (DUF58 family)
MNTPAVPLRDLSPEAALRRLELLVLHRVDGLLQGDHLGLFPGPGSEAGDPRTYVPGQDDPRHIDWNVTARTTEVHVRDLIADRELETWALVDASASMDFGTAVMEKRDLAAAAAVAIGRLAQRSGDRFGAYVLGPSGVRVSHATSGRAHLLNVLRALATADRVEPGAHVPSLTEGIAALARHRRRGLRVIVSDFLEPVEPDPARGESWATAMRRLATRQRVLAIEVVDPRELELPAMGVLSLVDPETGRVKEVNTSSAALRKRYREAAAAGRQQIRQVIRSAGAAHLVLRTDRDWVRDLAEFTIRQRRLFGRRLVITGVKS